MTGVSLNWLSFMINEGVINDKKMIKNGSVDEKEGSNSYQEFKKLYQTIKK
jgi:hypothetical protein